MSEVDYPSILDSSVEFQQDGYDVDDQNDIHKKDWFGPAFASMARLNQIQTNVYNMGFQNVSNLKGTKKVRLRQKPSQRTGVSSRHNLTTHQETDINHLQNSQEQGSSKPISYTELKTNPPLSTVSYQETATAWGSNHSIPELIAQHSKATKKPLKLRPSSAKIQATSRGKFSLVNRPHSAKEPLCSNRKQKPFGVSGQKKNVFSSRPPSKGYTPACNMNTPVIDPYLDGVWAGPPAGHILDPLPQAQDSSADENAKPGSKSPLVPPSSPVFGETMNDDEINVIGNCFSPHTPPLLRRPLPEPIHLSLPSINDLLDSNQDDGLTTNDDLDTERLLQQADLYVDKQKLKDDDRTNPNTSLISRNATLPDHNEKDMVSEMKGDNKYPERFETRSHLKSHRKETSRKYTDSSDERSDVQYQGSFKSDEECRISSDHRENVMSQTSGKREKTKTKTFLTPDDTESFHQPLPLVAERATDKTRSKKSCVNVNKGYNDFTTRSGVKIREDRNITVDITPRNIGRKVTGASFTKQSRESETNISSNKHDSLIWNKKNDKTLVSMVSVEYEADNNTNSVSGLKLKSKKKKTMDEVQTVMSQLSTLNYFDDESNRDEYDVPVSQLLHKSEGEKNYYEISRSQSRQSSSSDGHYENDKISVGEANYVYKTTKTIEFGEANLQEATSKSVIGSHDVPKPKLNVKHRPPKPPSQLLPSVVRQQQKMQKVIRDDLNGETDTSDIDKDSVEETKSNMNELESLLQEAKVLAQTSIYDATKIRPPSGKKISTQVSSNYMKTDGEQRTNLRPSSGVKLISVTNSAKEAKRTVTPKRVLSAKASISRCFHSEKSEITNKKPVIINSIKEMAPINTAESKMCKDMKCRMAALGLDVDSRVLEKALFAPAGESLYYEVPGMLPKNPSAGLLTHYKNWLSEDYKRIQVMEKRLAQDDQLRLLQKIAAEKKAKKAAAKESKGKKKKKKLVRRNSVV